MPTPPLGPRLRPGVPLYYSISETQQILAMSRFRVGRLIACGHLRAFSRPLNRGGWAECASRSFVTRSSLLAYMKRFDVPADLHRLHLQPADAKLLVLADDGVWRSLLRQHIRVERATGLFQAGLEVGEVPVWGVLVSTLEVGAPAAADVGESLGATKSADRPYLAVVHEDDEPASRFKRFDLALPRSQMSSTLATQMRHANRIAGVRLRRRVYQKRAGSGGT